MGERTGRTVEVVPYRDEWPAAFETIRRALAAAVGEVAISIEHIGSTAVPGLSAKPTIDILMVVEATERFLGVLGRVEELGFDYREHNTFVGSESHPAHGSTTGSGPDSRDPSRRAGGQVFGRTEHSS